MFIVTRIWISISDLDLNSIIESHNENLKNLLNFIIIIKMANGMGSFAFFGFISRPWHFWAHINYHCDPFDTRTPNFYFLGWFSDLFFWPKKRCAFWLRITGTHSPSRESNSSIWLSGRRWGRSVSRVTHTHPRHSPKSPPACGSTAWARFDHSVVSTNRPRGGENPLTTGVKQAVPYRTGREARYLHWIKSKKSK